MTNSENPLVSVIVSNWNGRKFLANCLTSLEGQEYSNFEVILADNYSSDSSVEFVEENFPWICIHKLPQNLGYTGANNSAAKIAQGKYLFFLNNDTKVAKDCLLRLVTTAEENPKVGVLACKQLTYNGDALISEGMGCDLFGFPSVGKIFYADGASLFIRRDLFNMAGGFDEKHFMVGEDVDLCWRVHLLGYAVMCAKKAIVHHISGGSLVGGKANGRSYTTNVWRRYLGERNILRNLLKNYSFVTLSIILPLYLTVNIAEIILFSALGRVDVVKGVYLKAWWYNLVNFNDTWKERIKIQKSRKISDCTILKRMEWKIGKFEVLKKVGIPKIVS